MHTLKYLRDPANAITMIGLILAFWGIGLALNGCPNAAVGLVLWSVFADHMDGLIAKRTKNRSEAMAEMGKNLDSFSDLVSGCLFPAIFLLTTGGTTLLSIATGTVLIGIGALRLGTFNTASHIDGDNVGLPIIYDVPAIAVSILIFGSSFPLPAIVQMVLALCILLHFTHLPVPRIRGLGYPAILAICAGASALLMDGYGSIC